jgi:hypothetical protein
VGTQNAGHRSLCYSIDCIQKCSSGTACSNVVKSACEMNSKYQENQVFTIALCGTCMCVFMGLHLGKKVIWI